MERVQEETQDFAWGYVSGLGVPMQRQGITIGSDLDGFRSSPQPIVVIDKADVLVDREILPTLDEFDIVSWIAIAADEHGFMADIEGGIESRVRSAETIVLDRYSIDELVDILRGRVEAGLNPVKVKSGALEEIADRSLGNAT